jgi:hypothetical protein
MADPYAAFSSPVSKGGDDPYASFSSPVKGGDTKPKLKAGALATDVGLGGAQGLVDTARNMADTAIHAAVPLLPPGMSPMNALVETGGRAIGDITQRLTGNKSAGQVAQNAMAGYTPKTEAGKVARTVGQMAPNALFPGSGVQRAANVIVPAIGAELGKRGAKALGANEQQQEIVGSVGGMAGGLAANLRIGPNASPKPVKPVPAADIEALRTQKNAAYKAVDEAGVQYRPEAVDRLVSDIKQAMSAEEMDPDLHPKVNAVMKRLETLRGQPQTMTRLDKIRQVINENVLAAPEKGQRRLGYIMRDAIDGFIGDSKPEDVMSNGDAGAAAQSLKAARDLNTRVAKVDALNEAVERGRRRAQSTGSGGNVDNAIRQEVRKMADRGRNWTPAEKAGLDRIVRGGNLQNELRKFGKLSPDGNGLMTGLNLDMAMKTGGTSLVVTVPAMVSKYIADGMTKAKVTQIADLMASGKEGQAQRLAYNDAKAARLIGELKRLKLGGSTVTALSAGSPDQPQQRPSGRSASR